ncbi:antitoxin Xre/MbcA/ParS toxin-binding domain-containing protein [Pseudomonas sp. Irchel s3b2]|uniref:antitoxin Xre/MbcA/ParS toxin-binding domain-containing protein n=1 Tax=Pseudomonas sp. Irchel s3b2 TaxID=2009073 RepID=UPI000BA3F970|nr:antitoxin Xre/MbcA/ParS toxin-binding domain-containing protein [Pseudomonas sp. Irchel s3b2]
MSIEYQPGPYVPGGIWEAIGLPSRGARLYELVHQGFPFELLDQTATFVQMPRADISHAICVSPTTLVRRAKAGRFNTVESDRLVALIVVFEEAISLFENDMVAVAKWMSSPVQGLGLKRPLDMLGTRVETNAVLELIGRLERGVVV